MPDTLTVDIPADVKDNSRTIRAMRWRGGVLISEEDLKRDRGFAAHFGHAVYEWDDVAQNPDGTPGARQSWVHIVSEHGHSLELFLIEYFTRVKCADCEYHWAQYYVSVDVPHGDGSAFPQCGNHAAAVRSYQRHHPDAKVAFSEPLRIGQH